MKLPFYVVLVMCKILNPQKDKSRPERRSQLWIQIATNCKHVYVYLGESSSTLNKYVVNEDKTITAVYGICHAK